MPNIILGQLTKAYPHHRIEEHKASCVANITTPFLGCQHPKKGHRKLDCLIFEMLFIHERKPKRNVIAPFLSFLVRLFQNEYKCKTFHMKMSSACSFIFMQIKIIFIRIVSHLDLLWNRGTRELGNDQLDPIPRPKYLFDILNYSQRRRHKLKSLINTFSDIYRINTSIYLSKGSQNATFLLFKSIFPVLNLRVVGVGEIIAVACSLSVY